MKIDFESYEQYMAPNIKLLKEQIIAAMGKSSMAEFAERIKYNAPSIKVSAATLSRICNGGNKRPINLELLKAIADVADKDSGVTFDTLAKANGYRSKEEAQKVMPIEYRHRDLLRERMLAERNSSMIIQNEIGARGYQVKQIPRRTASFWNKDIKFVFPRVFTFGFFVSGMSPASTWKFALDSTMVAKSEDGNCNDEVCDRAVQSFIRNCSSIFASDSYESEYYENEKFSFVFRDKILYDLFLKRIRDIRVNGFMTVILIDLVDMEVKEEVQIPRFDDATKMSFFKEPLVDEEDDAISFDIFDFEE